MAGESIDEVYRSVFRGTRYLLALNVERGGSVMHIEVENESTNERWHGEFSSKYIEQITQKTGNFKRFMTFVKMLSAALQKNNDAVFVDLLTYGDLENLKSRKNGQNSSNVSSRGDSSFRGSKKRYLILTYTVEFDRVHYPLPLSFEEEPDAESLKRTVARLRNELRKVDRRENLAVAEGDGKPETPAAAVAAMKEELDALRKANKRLKGAQGAKNATSAAYERLREESELTINRCKKEIKALMNRLTAVEADRSKLSARMARNEGSLTAAAQDSSRHAKSVSKKVAGLEKALSAEKAYHLRTKKKAAMYAEKAKEEIMGLKKQIQTLRLNVRDAKAAARRATSSRSPSVGTSRRGTSMNRSTTSVRTSNTSVRSNRSVRSSTSSVRSNQGRSRSPNRSAVNRSARSSTRPSTAGSRGRSATNRGSGRASRRQPSPYDSGYSSAGSSVGSSVEGRARTRLAKRRTTKSSAKKKAPAGKTTLRSASAERRRQELVARDRMRVPTARPSPKRNANGIRSKPPTGGNTSRSILRTSHGTSSSSAKSTSKSSLKKSSLNSSRSSSTRGTPDRKKNPPAPAARVEPLLPPDSPGLKDNSFDANTEMADIDRRLNALQDFLKEAKQGGVID
jgi:coiled-coil domain-containing protein 61